MDGNFVRFGEAGDCFSMAMCPQGAFSINLAGTALAVSPRTNWITRGNKAAHYINRLDVSNCNTLFPTSYIPRALTSVISKMVEIVKKKTPTQPLDTQFTLTGSTILGLDELLLTFFSSLIISSPSGKL